MPSIAPHHKSRNSTRQPTRTPNAQGCPAGWIWFVAGVLFGMFLAFLLYLQSLNPATETQSLTPPVTNAPSTEVKIPTAVPTPEPKPVTVPQQSFQFYDLEPAATTPGPVVAVPANENIETWSASNDNKPLPPQLTPEIINRPAQERPKPAPKPKPKPVAKKPRPDEVVLELTLPSADQLHNLKKPAEPQRQTRTQPRAANPLEPVAGLTVQIAAFRDLRDAKLLHKELRQLGFKVQIYTGTVNNRQWYRVRLPTAANERAAERLQTRLRQAGYSSIRVN